MDLQPSVHRVSTTDYVLSALREAIRDGRIRQGEHLREETIARALDIGRGTVREAVRQLVQEGLAEHQLHRGVFVRTIQPEDIVDVYAAREAVESFAAERIVSAAEPADLAGLETALERLRQAVDAMGDRPSQDVIAADIAFHGALVEAARSPRLTRIYETLATETRMALLGHPPYPSVDYVGDHERVLAALRDRDPAAPQVVREHLRLSATLITSDADPTTDGADASTAPPAPLTT